MDWNTHMYIYVIDLEKRSPGAGLRRNKHKIIMVGQAGRVDWATGSEKVHGGVSQSVPGALQASSTAGAGVGP